MRAPVRSSITDGSGSVVSTRSLTSAAVKLVVSVVTVFLHQGNKHWCKDATRKMVIMILRQVFALLVPMHLCNAIHQGPIVLVVLLIAGLQVFCLILSTLMGMPFVLATGNRMEMAPAGVLLIRYYGNAQLQ